LCLRCRRLVQVPSLRRTRNRDMGNNRPVRKATKCYARKRASDGQNQADEAGPSRKAAAVPSRQETARKIEELIAQEAQETQETQETASAAVPARVGKGTPSGKRNAGQATEAGATASDHDGNTVAAKRQRRSNHPGTQ